MPPSVRTVEVRAATAVPVGDSITTSLRVNGVDTAVGCTIPAGQTLCTDTDTVQLPPRSGMSMRMVHTITGESRDVGWSFNLG